MRLFSALLALAVPVTVVACEGECIVGVTNAFLGNYTDPIRTVMTNIATQLSDLLPSHPSPSTALHYLAPLHNAYVTHAYGGMEAALFADYFHGRCARGGSSDPPGCPNPDCPVVCGTSGSMVHFYPILRLLAYNQTRALLQKLVAPGSPAYALVEQNVADAVRAHARRVNRIFPRNLIKSKAHATSTSTSTHSADTGAPIEPEEGNEMVVPLAFRKRSQDINSALQKILQRIPTLLEDACGGTADESTDALPDCSWEQEMKDYMLIFP